MPGKPGWSKLSSEDVAAVVHRYVENRENAAALSREYGVTLQTILSYVRRAGHEPRGRGGQERVFTEDEIGQMAALWDGGMAQWAIGQRFGCSQIVVSRVLDGRGRPKERRIAAGERHGWWKGGRTMHGSGYVLVKVVQDDPMAAMRNRQGYVMEHRLVMARKLGRPLRPSETVHHVNGDITDNRPENLQLRQGKHGNGVVYRCRCCGSTDVETVAIDATD